jgi:hypothetical protein
VLSQGCVQSLVKQAVERSWAAALRLLQGVEIDEPILWPHCDCRIAAAKQNKVHQQPPGAAVAVLEGMDADQLAVYVTTPRPLAGRG